MAVSVHPQAVVGTGPDLTGAVRPVFQPVVDLDSGLVVGYEALARGAGPYAGLNPGEMFARARAEDVEGALDWQCRAAALAVAAAHPLPPETALFVNAEPRHLAGRCPEHLASVLDGAAHRRRLVVEITERDLVRDPAGLLRAVAGLRDEGWGVALDDVGAAPESLALMPFVEPDLIKLDLRLVQGRTSEEVAAVSTAVVAQAERTGAVVLAEGIETEQHRARAVALGATLGQGYLFGRPGDLPPAPMAPPSSCVPSLARPGRATPLSPFSLVARHPGVRVAPKSLLLPMSRYLEQHAHWGAERPVLLAAFERAEFFTRRTAARYTDLVPRCAFVGALGVGMPEEPVPGVRGATLAADDPLRGEWVVAVVGPHFAGALVAQDLGDAGDLRDGDRRFAFLTTYDRDLVVAVARSLLLRIDCR